ncbi:MAG: trimethylamine methyltransferase family protein [Dehalobacterium sp.]
MNNNLYAGHDSWNGFGLKLFSDAQIEALHLTTLKVMERTGVFVESQKALKIFADNGANVNYDTNIVKFPAYIVEEAIRCAPGSVLLAGRNPKNDIVLEGDKVHFCSFGEAVSVIDPFSGQLRKAVKDDVCTYAKIVDALDNFAMCWDSLVPSDVDGQLYNLHSFEAYLNNTSKNCCVATPDGNIARLAIEMGAAVVGGKEKIKERPIFLAGTCPQSPLFYHEGLCDAIIELSMVGAPIIIMSAATCGGTGPVTLAGTIVVHNAELLTGLILSQLVLRGTPFLYGSCTSILDLRKANATFGCPELGMISAAVAKLTQHYKIPNVVAGFWTDSKVTDMQSGHEKTLNSIIPALAGANMVFGTGGIEGGLTLSYGQLVADNEFAGMIKRVLRGIPVNEEHLALDLIHSVGPRGNFLAEEHTIKYMKECQSQPKMLDRGNRSEWSGLGAKDMAARCDDEARRILEEHKPEPLPQGVAEKLRTIIKDGERNGKTIN